MPTPPEVLSVLDKLDASDKGTDLLFLTAVMAHTTSFIAFAFSCRDRIGLHSVIGIQARRRR